MSTAPALASPTSPPPSRPSRPAAREALRSVDRLISWSPVLLLGGLAALTYWLDAQIQPPAPRVDGSRRHDVDIYVENVRGVNLGPNGKPLHILRAARAEHYPDDDSTVIAKPDLTVKDPKQPNFQVTANEARVSGDRNDVWFTGSVHARREPQPGDAGGVATLVTEYLHVLPREHRADTDKPVAIADARGNINATGMTLDAANGVVRFLSRVHGSIEPKAVDEAQGASDSKAGAQPGAGKPQP